MLSLKRQLYKEISAGLAVSLENIKTRSAEALRTDVHKCAAQWYQPMSSSCLRSANQKATEYLLEVSINMLPPGNKR